MQARCSFVKGVLRRIGAIPWISRPSCRRQVLPPAQPFPLGLVSRRVGYAKPKSKERFLRPHISFPYRELGSPDEVEQSSTHTKRSHHQGHRIIIYSIVIFGNTKCIRRGRLAAQTNTPSGPARSGADMPQKNMIQEEKKTKRKVYPEGRYIVQVVRSGKRRAGRNRSAVPGSQCHRTSVARAPGWYPRPAPYSSLSTNGINASRP